MAKNLVYVGVAILAIIALVLGYKIIQVNKNNQQSLQQNTPPVNSTSNQAISTSTQSATIKQPGNSIADNHPNLVQKPSEIDNGHAIVYTLNSKVTQITNTELSLESKGDPLPIFKIGNNVVVVKAIDQTKSQPASLSDIKSGTMVTLIVIFDKTAKTYTVTHITLL